MEPWYIKLGQELQEAKRFEADRVTARALSSRYHAKRAVSALSHGQCSCSTVVGYAALWHTAHSDWYELQVMKQPMEEFKRQMLIDLAELLEALPRHKHAFVVTDDPLLMCCVSRCGFLPVTVQQKPDVMRWASRIHVVGKLPPSVHAASSPSPMDGQRWMFAR